MDNNFTNQNSENNELESKVSAVTPIVPDPEPLAGMGAVNDVNMGQPAVSMPNPSMGQVPDMNTVMGQAPMNQTMMGQPPMNQTMMGQTPMNQTMMGQTPMNQTMMGQAPMNQTMMGQAPVNQTMMGQAPVNQEPVTGQISTNQASMGQNTMMGQTPAGQNTITGQAPMDQNTMMGQGAYGQNPAMGQTPMQNTMMGQQYGFGQNPAMGQPAYGTDYSSLGQGMQPTGKPGKVKKPKKPKKPMTKGKIAGIIAGSTVGVAAVVCGVIFIPKLFRSPKKVVLDAVENTFGISTDADTYENDKYGLNETMNEYMLNGGETNITVTIDGSPLGTNDNIGFSWNNTYDPNEKLENFEAAFLYNGTNAASIDVIGTDTTTYVEIPGLIDGYFSFPNDLQQLFQSPMFGGGEIPFDLPYTTIDYFAQSEQLAETGQLSINSGYVNALETLWDNVSVDKKGKKKIEVNGETVKATKYVVTIKEEDIEEAAQEALDGILEMAKEQEEALAEQGLSSADLEMIMSQFNISALINGDFSFDVYVKDDKVVKIEAEDTISIMYLNLNYNFFLDIDDNNVSSALTLSVPMAQTSMKIGFNVYDFKGDTNGSFYAKVDDEVIDFTFDSVRTESGTVVTRNFDFSVNENGVSQMKGKFDITTDDADNSFDMVLSFMADGDTLKLTAAGAVNDFEPGKSIDVSIDEISLIADDEKIFELAIDYSIDAGSPSAHDIDSSKPVYDITTMTEQGFEDIIMDNSTLILQWMSDFISNTGELGQSILGLLTTTSVEEPYEPEEPSTPSLDFSNAYLSEDGYEVKIEDALSGFVLDYISDYFIDLVDGNNTVMEYEIDTAVTAEDLLIGLDQLDCEIIEYVENEAIDCDGLEVRYTKLVYNPGSGNRAIFKFIRYIDENVYLVVTVTSESDAFSVENLVDCITDNYVTVY